MSIPFYFNLSHVSRGERDRSVVAASAYRSGAKLYDQRRAKYHDYTKKKGIVYTEILLPHNAPTYLQNREELWNEVESTEPRKDSRLAKDLILMLPRGLNLKQQITTTKKFLNRNFIKLEMGADIAIHDKGDGNPHAHVLIPDRPIIQSGFASLKNRALNSKKMLKKWRENWDKEVNNMLQKAGIVERSSHKTLYMQGIDREPTRPLGYKVLQMKERGIITSKMAQHLEILERNICHSREHSVSREGWENEL